MEGKKPMITRVFSSCYWNEGDQMMFNPSRLARGVFAAVGALLVTQTSYGITRDQYADSISVKTSQEVWDLLRGQGIGKCRVAQGNTTCCACNYYFKTGVVDSLGYDGAPVYNTDNSDPASYTGSPTASRQTAKTTQASTGCFPMANFGLFGGGATHWGGNNTSEVTMDGKDYSKALVVQLIRDTGDPCKINDVLAKLGGSFQVEATVTGSTSKISFKDRGDGKPDPSKCYLDTNTVVIVNGKQSHLKSPYGNAEACKTIFRRIVNVLNKDATGGGQILSVPLISQQDAALANAMTNGTFASAVTIAYDKIFQQAATSSSYKTQTRATALAASPVDMGTTAVPLSSVQLTIPTVQMSSK